MMLAHQLLVAAIGPCGLVFLLHVDSVNSIRCKVCNNTGPDCHAGNVPSIECCPEDRQCITLIYNSSTSIVVSTYRGCAIGGETYCYRFGSRMTCYIYCCTDNCN